MEGSEKYKNKEGKAEVKLDRSAFRILSWEEKGFERNYWLEKTPFERLCAGWYLTCCAYNLPYSSDHKLDRTQFSMRKNGD